MNVRSETCILLPVLNEERTIGGVIDGFREVGFENILVVDGDSTDATRAIARERGARVIIQSGRGKGQAIREAREYIDAPYILMADGDQTYRPEDADAILDPLASGDADHVIGDRFAAMHPDAMTGLNRIGNRLINRAFHLAHTEDYGDILSGYRAFTREGFNRLYLDVDGFGIETEIAVEAAKNDLRTVVVPVHYDPRPDGSETNLSPVSHGAHIIATLYRLAKTNNPVFYFGVLGALATLVGALVGAYVGIEWFTVGRSHDVLALVSASGFLLGVQLLVFGVLADMMLSFHKSQMREIRRNARVGDGEG
jgi:dolichol-phosphate mannosyltransferase